MFKSTILLLLATLALASAANFQANYFTFRFSGVRCIKYPCATYVASLLNGGATNIPIDDITFDSSINQTKIFDYKLSEVVIYGVLSTVYLDSYPINRITVQAAYRLLPLAPGDASNRTGGYYGVGSSGIFCIRAPCPSLRANYINGEASLLINDIDTPYEHYPQFDNDWLNNKMFVADEPNKAIVQGRIVSGVLRATAVFVNIIDQVNGCPPIPKIGCAPDYIMTYNRGVDRCLSLDGCVLAGACILSIPVCNPGYTLVGVNSAPHGCPTYYCDAEFLE